MRKTLLVAGAALLLAAGPGAGPAKNGQDRLRLDVQRPDRRDRQRHAQFLRARARPSGPQDGRPAGRGDLRRRQQKPDVGKQKTEKLIESDKVDFIAGYIWSNVLLASLKPVVDSKTFLVIANAGPSQIAGELCSPYVFSTSWQNDQTPQAMGHYMNQKGVKTRVPDRPELCRRQGHAGGRGRDLQGQDRRRRSSPTGRTSSTSPPNCRRPRPPIRTRSSCSIRARPACSSCSNTRRPA